VPSQFASAKASTRCPKPASEPLTRLKSKKAPDRGCHRRRCRAANRMHAGLGR
jgi:hypothetical protein